MSVRKLKIFVIPASEARRESFFGKDSGQAGMTDKGQKTKFINRPKIVTGLQAVLYLFLYLCLFYFSNAFASDISRITILMDPSDRTGRPGAIVRFQAETVSDMESSRLGLSGRHDMPEDHGMLFIMNDNEEIFFWMRGMRFSLDILFFDKDRRVTEIFHNLLPCDNCPLIKPSKPAFYALEINAGMAKKHGIRIGDRFEFENR